MTSKLRAKKFRIPRPDVLEAVDASLGVTDGNPELGSALAHAPQIPAPNTPAPRIAAPQVPSLDEEVARPLEAPTGSTNIDEIRKEGLTGRQLRMARRTAQRHDLPATSDFDAVRLLRQAGIDPFQRSNLLELAPKSDGSARPPAKSGRASRPQLPQRRGASENLPALIEEEDPALRRAREVERIQQSIIRRRQKKLALLGVRLAFFVGLPTLLAGWYFYTVASPMYSTKSAFLIQQNSEQSAGGGGGLMGMISGGGGGGLSDGSSVQSYLTSIEAMIRLDQDHNFIAHYSDPAIDPLARHNADASNEEAFKVFKKSVKIGYDPTEGLVNMEVIAASPDASVEFSNALIHYAEERVSNITQRLRDDQMKGAIESFEDAQIARNEALDRLVTLQQELAVIDSKSAVASIQHQIMGLEQEVDQMEKSLAIHMENARPNTSKVNALKTSIRINKDLIEAKQAELTQTTGGADSLASKNARMIVAEADYQTREMMVQAAVQSVEAARVAADRQARYLATSVAPVRPEDPSYPRKFENTLLSFLIFGGVYLIMSLTASILREQV